ncbi:rusA-like resolvase [Mycobacterium phage Aegeus]|nr:RusA-like resolvase [Mycobacterium phage Baudelaire]WKW86579.1 rusA-like resolvase [Mycobacterium phage Aegeus]
MEHLITVPMTRPPMLSNDQRRWTWPQVRRAKQQVGETIAWLIRQAGIKNLEPSQVKIVWYVPDKRRRDVDSLGPFAKAALDGMVDAGVWPGDDSKWVTKLSMSIDQTQTKHARIEIRVSEN